MIYIKKLSTKRTEINTKNDETNRFDSVQKGISLVSNSLFAVLL